MKRGNGAPPDVKKMRATTRPDRRVVPLFGNQVTQAVVADCPPPADMTDAAKAIWISKVERYRQRGQPVEGFEGTLRQYCELEAVVNRMFRGDIPLVVSAIAAHRLYAGEFYDTPGSQQALPRGNPPGGNPFGRNGRRA